MQSIRVMLAALLVLLSSIVPTHAAELPAPDGEVLLKISGNIKNCLLYTSPSPRDRG